MTTNLIKPSRIDFDKVDINQIQRILSTGTLEALAPDEREYYSLMEMVRGLRARMRINGKLVTKAGIIRLLKSEPYGLSDWMPARCTPTVSISFIRRITYARRLSLICMLKRPKIGRILFFLWEM